jgi:ribose transport system permease protein
VIVKFSSAPHSSKIRAVQKASRNRERDAQYSGPIGQEGILGRPSAQKNQSSLIKITSGPTFGITAATILMFLVGGFFVPQSVSSGAVLGMLPFAAILIVISVGQTLVIQQAGIDLSVPGVVSLSAVIVCYFNANMTGALQSVTLAIFCSLVVCGLAGAVSGVLISKMRIAPIVATLGMNALLYGLVLKISGGVPVAAPRELTAFANGTTFGVNNLVFVAVILSMVATFVVKATVVGRYFEAVGAGNRAARAAGIVADNYQIAAYTAAALLYAAGGILLGGLMQTPSTQQGDSYLMPSIAATVLGGTSLFGGKGNLAATFVAALFLSQLQQLVLTTGASVGVQYLFQGVTILVGVAIYGTNFREALSQLRAFGRSATT